MDIPTAIDFLNAKFALILRDALTERRAKLARDSELAKLHAQFREFGAHPGTKKFADEMRRESIKSLNHRAAREINSLKGKRAATETTLQNFEQDWYARLEGLETGPTSIEQLKSLDAQLEDKAKELVPSDNRAGIHDYLKERYGLSKITTRSMKNAVAGSLREGWIALKPNPNPAQPIKIDPTARQLALMPSALLAQDLYTLPGSTVGELAQLYADHGAFEVRLHSDLIQKPGRFKNANFQKTKDLVQFIGQFLVMEQLKLEHKSGGVVELHDQSANEQAKLAKNPPKPATAKELSAAESATSWANFWQVIDRSRTPDGNENRFRRNLRKETKSWTLAQILGFKLRLEQALEESYTWGIWGVAYLINGGCSDDGFHYFRLWLIAQGREVFSAAMERPESIANVASQNQDNEFEMLGYIPAELYARRSRKPMPIVSSPISTSPEPAGRKWEEDDLPQLFPEVARLFT